VELSFPFSSSFILFRSKRVLKLVQGKPKDYRLDGPFKLRFTHDARTEENLFTRIELLVELLS